MINVISSTITQLATTLRSDKNFESLFKRAFPDKQPTVLNYSTFIGTIGNKAGEFDFNKLLIKDFDSAKKYLTYLLVVHIFFESVFNSMEKSAEQDDTFDYYDDSQGYIQVTPTSTDYYYPWENPNIPESNYFNQDTMVLDLVFRDTESENPRALLEFTPFSFDKFCKAYVARTAKSYSEYPVNYAQTDAAWPNFTWGKLLPYHIQLKYFTYNWIVELLSPHF